MSIIRWAVATVCRHGQLTIGWTRPERRRTKSLSASVRTGQPLRWPTRQDTDWKPPALDLENLESTQRRPAHWPTMRCESTAYYAMSQKTRTPLIFWHNFFKKTGLISIILGILGIVHLYLVLKEIKAMYKFCVHSSLAGRPTGRDRCHSNS